MDFTTKYGIEVMHKGQWLLTNKRFDSRNEAEDWASWNYKRGGEWQVVEIAED